MQTDRQRDIDGIDRGIGDDLVVGIHCDRVESACELTCAGSIAGGDSTEGRSVSGGERLSGIAPGDVSGAEDAEPQR
jgi:hypothetical protein